MLGVIHDLGQREVAEFKGDRVPPSWPGQAQRAARPGRRPPELELTSVGLESVGPAGAACPRRTFADLAPTSVGPLRVGRTSCDVLSRTWRQRRSDLSASVGPLPRRTFADLAPTSVGPFPSRSDLSRRSDLSSVGPFPSVGPFVGRPFRRSALSSVGPFGPFVPTSIGAAWSDLLSLLGVGRI
jgi:hypothetical protein